MKFSERSLSDFKRIYKKVFSEELSDEQVKEKAEYLLEVFKAVYSVPNFEQLFDNKIQDEDSK